MPLHPTQDRHVPIVVTVHLRSSEGHARAFDLFVLDGKVASGVAVHGCTGTLGREVNSFVLRTCPILEQQLPFA